MAIKIECTENVAPYMCYEERVHYILFIPYNHIQYYNNAMYFESESPIDNLGINMINEALSAGQDAVTSLLDDILNAGRTFSYVMMALGLYKDYLDDVAESAKKVEHFAAAQAATDKQSYMVVVITQTTTYRWTRKTFGNGRYENYGTRTTTHYYELSEFASLFKE